LETNAAKRKFVPMTVKPSVAQAAMIGNPVSMPRVIHLVDLYNRLSGMQKVFFVEVSEQEVMDWELVANRNGHIACTHGGESLAGLVASKKQGLIADGEIAVVDSTAHALKFSGFQQMYFDRQFPEEYNITSNPSLINMPVFIRPEKLDKIPTPGKPLTGKDFKRFVEHVSQEIAKKLELNQVSK
jgi:threonine synthase